LLSQLLPRWFQARDTPSEHSREVSYGRHSATLSPIGVPMILWTIQPASTWATWQREGTLSSAWHHTPIELRPQYEWMAQRFAQLVPAPSASAALVWAWLQFGGAARARPDLRRRAHLPPRTPGVRIELQLDATEVLLSDFELWHFVLNGWPIPPRGTIHSANWSRIFDLQFRHRDVALPFHMKRIQAVFWSAPLSSIRSVTPFVAR